VAGITALALARCTGASCPRSPVRTPSPTGGAEQTQPHLAGEVDPRSSLLGFGRVGGNLERKRKQARLGNALAAGHLARQQNGVFHVARIGLVPADQIEGGPVVHRGADNR